MILFYFGEDTFTLNQEIKNLKEKFAKDYGRGGLEEFFLNKDLDDAQLKNRLVEILQNQGLFATRKLVILINFLDEINQFPDSEGYLLKEVEKADIELMFLQTESFDKRLKFYKALQKQADTHEFKIPTGQAMETRIKNYLHARNFAITAEALTEFINLLSGEGEEIPPDLWQVTAELEKLMLYKIPPAQIDQRGEIGILDVRSIVRPNIHYNVFSLTNLFAEGKTAQAVSLLEKMLGGGDLKSQSLQDRKSVV